MKKVSFVVAAYNHELFIKDALDSIWSDDYPFKEIVIVDDGSSDDTAAIIKEWCEVKKWNGIVFHGGPNKGITSTLNKLIEISTGDYIRLCSSDDLLEPSGTRRMVEVLDSDKSAMAVFGDANIIDAASTILHESSLLFNGANKKRLMDQRLMVKEMISNWAVSGPVILIKKDFYEEFGMYDEAMVVDDWDLYIRLMASGGLKFIDEYVASYRIHGNNISKTKTRNRRIVNLTSQASVVDRNIDIFSDKYIQSLLLSEKNLLLAKVAYLSNRFDRCILYLLKYFLFKLKPLIEYRR